MNNGTGLKFTILGSGSGGNCTYIETAQARFLVDAGFSGRQIDERLRTIGRSLDDIQAVFLTHEHQDHVAGLSALANRRKIPVYSNSLTCEALRSGLTKFNGWQIFKTGQSVAFGDIEIETFSIPHDAYDPVAFVLCWGNHRIGFLTDLGYATKLVLDRVKDCSLLVLESNHDMQLLREDKKRPWAVKQRILARHGHLSNEAAAEVAQRVASDRLQHLYLAHLSGDCNRPDLAREVVGAKLSQEGIRHVQIHDTWQDRPCETMTLI